MPMPVPITITIKFYHCADGDRMFDRQIGFQTHSVRQCKFDSDCEGDGDRKGACKWALKVTGQLIGIASVDVTTHNSY